MIANIVRLLLCSVATSALPNSTGPVLDMQNNNHRDGMLQEGASQQSVRLPKGDETNVDMAESERTEEWVHDLEEGAVEERTEVRLRGSIGRATSTESHHRQLGRRRRRRRRSDSGFDDPCDAIETAVCKTSDYVLCVAGCLDISSCKDACEKKIIKPCEDALKSSCDKDALDICEEAVKKAGEESCTEICAEAAATADAAGGGPEDPAADVVAADIAASCEMSCEAAIDDSGLTPGTNAFAEAVCKGIGF